MLYSIVVIILVAYHLCGGYSVGCRTDFKQTMWPPGSADTVSPRPPLTLTFDRFTTHEAISHIGNKKITKQPKYSAIHWVYDVSLV